MSIEPKSGEPAAAGLPASIQFHYLKSTFHRVIRVDGVFGGIGPNLTIQLQLYSERVPIPKTIVHAVTPQGRLGEEIIEARVTKDGLVREVEISAIMTLDAATAIHTWLGAQIEEARVQQVLRATLGNPEVKA